MTQVNMLDAKTRLSQLVEAVESGAEDEIIIARNGKPAARLVPVAAKKKVRLGLAKDHWPKLPDDPHADDDYIDQLFYGEGSESEA
ncbi:MAG: type II toxin-antitoxin system Phd/YefM family antitoxin [Brevundimonas sp.]|nr:MAG: type II toxin-antitoxin system Phd/YefM family antitoxin [Brevundimonas sp.]